MGCSGLLGCARPRWCGKTGNAAFLLAKTAGTPRNSRASMAVLLISTKLTEQAIRCSSQFPGQIA